MVKFLTETELCIITRRSHPTLKRWRANGHGPRFVKIEGRIFYEAAEIAAWLKAQIVDQGAPRDRNAGIDQANGGSLYENGTVG